MRRPLYLGLCLLLFCASLAVAAPQFPKLTGRVVDEAHVLSPGIRDRLAQKLEGYELGTSNQIVVVTLPSLQGLEIQDFGYQLGRYWAIGQKGKNNGALLIVVPKEKKAGIEVGYGLEGTLTDAATSQIIHDIILPAMQNGHIAEGIFQGANAMMVAAGGQSAGVDQPHGDIPAPVVIILMILLVIFCIRYPTLAWIIFSNLPSSSYRGGGGRSSGGFSGGGSFGGGGSSGSW